jgi:hypothetical protein
LAQRIDVLEGSFRQEVRLEVHRGLYIRGRVLDPAGEDAPEGYVMGTTELAQWPLSVRTDSEGTFALGPLVPGAYSLLAHAASFRAAGESLANSETVEAQGGDEGVVLRLRRGGSLSGTLLDGETGSGCAGGLVHSCVESDAVTMRQADEDGTFHVAGLLPGTYHLAGMASGKRAGVLRDVTVQAGVETGPLVLKLVPGALLRVKYAGERGYLNYRISSEGVLVGVNGISAGGTSETSVPAGRLLIQSRWLKEVEQQEIELAVGQEAELVFGEDR